MLLAITSCTSEEDDEQHIIEGTLAFNQGSSANGITVALYPDLSPAALGIDSIRTPFTLTTATQTTLACLVNDPLLETTTSAEGTFRLEPPGDIEGVLCILDTEYIYAILDASNLPDLDPLLVNSGQTLSGTYDTDVVVLADIPTRISGDVVFSATSSLTLEPGARLTFTDAAHIRVEGVLVAEGTEVASVSLLAHPLALDHTLTFTLFPGSPISMSYLVVAGPVHLSSQLHPLHLNSALFFGADGIAVNQSLLTDTLLIEDCIFLDCDTGIKLSDSNPAVIQNSAFLHCERAVHWNSSQGVVKESHFYRDSLGILFEGSSTGTIEKNHFQSCREDISLYSTLFPEISYNESRDSRDTFLFIRGGARPTVMFNNILNPEDYLVYIYTASAVEGRVQAQDNFWDYTDSLLIEEHIRDSLDQQDLLRVDISGFLYSPVEQ